MQALVVDPLNPSTIYAGSPDGVSKSTDGGKTWRLANRGLANHDVRALVIDPSAAAIYAGTVDNGGIGPVFKSTNGARTWVAASGGLPPFLTMAALMIDPTAPETLYAGNVNAGVAGVVYKSIDGGQSWTDMSTGFPCCLVKVRSLVVDPVDPLTVYAGTDDVTSTGDGVAAAYCNELSEQCGASEIYKSQDGAINWTSTLQNDLDVQFDALVIDPSNTSRVFAGHYGLGVWLTTDGGVTWAQTNKGLTAFFVSSFAVQPVSPYTVFAGTDGGGVQVPRVIERPSTLPS